MMVQARGSLRQALEGFGPTVVGDGMPVEVDDYGKGDGFIGEQGFEPVLQLFIVVGEQCLAGQGVDPLKIVPGLALGSPRQGLVEGPPVGVGEADDDNDEYGAGGEEDLDAKRGAA